MDIQAITSMHELAVYVTKYITKPEKEFSNNMSDILKDASTYREKLKQASNMFLNHRQVSSQEDVTRLCGLPLRGSSNQVKYVPSAPPKGRLRYLKNKTFLKDMQKDDSNIFNSGFIEYYLNRPSDLENMCFGEFAVSYDYRVQGMRKRDSDIDCKLRILRKRDKPTVLKTYCPKIENDSNLYYYSHLMRYLPFRKESELSVENAFEMFKKNEKVIKVNMFKIESFSSVVDEALAVRQDHLNGERDDNETNGDEDGHDEFSRINIGGDLNRVDGCNDAEYTVEYSHNICSLEELKTKIDSLNEKQKKLHDYVLSLPDPDEIDPKTENLVLYVDLGVGGMTGRRRFESRFGCCSLFNHTPHTEPVVEKASSLIRLKIQFIENTKHLLRKFTHWFWPRQVAPPFKSKEILSIVRSKFHFIISNLAYWETRN